MLNKTVVDTISAPFAFGAHKYKVQASTSDGSRSMAVFYIDARDVMDRLDEAAGPEEWSDSYTILAQGQGQGQGQMWAVECSLTVGGVTKRDVGEGEDPKSAYSDALKRAAVKFGVGRYLYSSPQVWAESEKRGKNAVFTKGGAAEVERVLVAFLSRLGVLPQAGGSAESDRYHRDADGEVWAGADPASEKSRQPLLTEAQRKRLHQVGTQFYGAEWDVKRPELVASATAKRPGRTQPVTSSKELLASEAQVLISGLEKRIALAAAEMQQAA